MYGERHRGHHQHHNQSLGYDQQQQQQYLPNNYVDNNYVDPYAQQAPYVPEVQTGPYDNYTPEAQPQQNYYDNAPLVQQESTKDKVINWLVYLLPLIFAIFNIVICGILFFGQGKNNAAPQVDFQVLDFVKSNLQAKPFLTLTQGTAGASCTAPNSLQTIGDWEGVQRGCVCSDGTTTSVALCPFKSNCKYVSPVSKLNFYQMNRKSYCGSNVQKFQYVGAAGSNQCGTGTSFCSNQFCVEGTTCAISQVVSAANSATFSYSQSSVPIVQLFVSPGNTVCFNPTLLPQFASKQSYPLLVQKPNGCDKYGDLSSYSTVVDNESWVNFLASNNDKTTVENIPQMSNYLSTTDTVNFVAVKRIGTQDNEACNKIDPTQMFNTVNKADNARTVALIGVTIVFFLCLIILIAAPLFYLVRAKVIHGHDMSKVPHTKILYVFFFIVCFVIFALSGTWIYQNYGSQGLTTVHDQMKGYSSNNCFLDKGPQTAVTNVFNYTGNALGQLGKLLPVLFYTNIGLFVFGVLLVMIQHVGLKEPFCTDPWDITHLHIIGN